MFVIHFFICEPIPSSIVLEDTKFIVGFVASCIGALVDIVMIFAGGGLVAAGGRIFGGLVIVACVSKCSGFDGFSGLKMKNKYVYSEIFSYYYLEMLNSKL